MTPEQMRDASMIELFKAEAQQLASVLSQGLLTLEREPTQAKALEDCMRAAHSLKGAARIVGLNDGVRVAHVMEDVLVAAIDQRLTLASAHIDALLKGTDLLLAVGALEPAQLTPKVDELTRHLEALLRNPAPVPTAVQPIAAPLLDTPAALTETPVLEATEPRDKVLRVTAQRLNHLLDVAGKALVQFQGIKPLDQSLQRLYRTQMTVARAMDGLREALLDTPLDTRAQSFLDDTRQGLLECQRLLTEHMGEFDEFAWQGSQRAQDVYDAALASRMRPFADVLTGQTRMVRDLGRALGKQVRFVVEGEHIQVDRDVLEGLEAPLTHLLRNALDHGIETPEQRLAKGKPAEGRITIKARHHAGMLMLSIADDGQGVDLARVRRKILERELASESTIEQLNEQELLAFLFLPGFSLSESVTEISGRGIGLDAVQHMLRRLRGGVRMEQLYGYGSRFYLEVPLTLSVVKSLVINISGEAYALPLASIDCMLRVAPEDIVLLEGRQHIWHQQAPVGLVSASQLLEQPEPATDAQMLAVVVLRDGERAFGLTVDAFVGERTLVVMPLDARLGKVKNVSAGALLEDGTPLLILDTDDVLQSIRKLLGSGQLERVDRHSTHSARAASKRILVVDDSLTVRELERKLLQAAGYAVSVAIDGMDGWNALRAETFDLLITDIDMPRMDGIELVSLVRRDKRLQAMPVMVVSYKDREEDRRRGLEAGADYYLAKASFHDQALLEAVQVLIGASTP